jgi:hypothetical protein
VNIRLNPHSEELLKEQLAHGTFHSPEEVIERALENVAQKESAPTGEAQRKAVREMLDFVTRNRVYRMIDFESQQPMFNWTHDKVSSCSKEDVWVEDELNGYEETGGKIVFNYPGSWPASVDRMEFEQNSDGSFHWDGVEGWPGHYWCIKSESEKHILLTGQWEDENPPGKGVFIAVFPKAGIIRLSAECLNTPSI